MRVLRDIIKKAVIGKLMNNIMIGMVSLLLSLWELLSLTYVQVNEQTRTQQAQPSDPNPYDAYAPVPNSTQSTPYAVPPSQNPQAYAPTSVPTQPSNSSYGPYQPTNSGNQYISQQTTTSYHQSHAP